MFNVRDVRCQKNGSKDTKTGLKQTGSAINKSGLVVCRAATRFSPPGKLEMNVKKKKNQRERVRVGQEQQ